MDIQTSIKRGTTAVRLRLVAPMCLFASLAFAALAEPFPETAEITSVAAAQRWPFSGLVDIDYTLFVVPTGGLAVVSVSATDMDHGTPLSVASLSGDGADGPVGIGPHRITWNLAADHPGFHAASLRVNVSAVPVSLDSSAVPPNVAATQGNTSPTPLVTVSWAAPWGSGTVLRYEVYRAASTNATPSLVATVTTTNYADTAVSFRQGYWYRVKAVYESKTSNFSAQAKGYWGDWCLQDAGYVDLMPLRSLLTGIEARTPDGVLADKELNRAMLNSTIADMDGDPSTISDAEMSILLRIQALNQDKDLISSVIRGDYTYAGMTFANMVELQSVSDAVKALTKY